MGNCLLSYRNWVDLAAASIAASSEAGVLRASRLKESQVRRRHRTAAGVTNYNVTVDFGAAYEVGVLALLQPDDPGAIDADGNATGWMASTDTVRHRLSAVAAGSGELLDDGPSAGGWIEGFGIHTHVLGSAVNPRYWKFDIDAASLATTPGYSDLGRAWAGPAIRPKRNFSYGWGWAWDDASEVTEVPRSGAQFVDLGPQRRVLTFALESLDEDEAKSIVDELSRIVGRRGQILFIPDPDEAYVGRQAIIGRLVEVAPITQPNFVQYARVFQIRQTL